jgi:hypothetical protein
MTGLVRAVQFFLLRCMTALFRSGDSLLAELPVSKQASYRSSVSIPLE